MKKILAGILFAMLCMFAAEAQSSQKIVEIDGSDTITYGQFCYLIATAEGTVSDSASFQQAFDEVRKTGVFYSDVLSTDPIPMMDAAYLCTKTWNIKGSLMYQLTKAPRYAFKQMQALDIIPLTSTPTSLISGHQALNVITLCIDYASKK